MPLLTEMQLTQVTQRWRRRVLEVGCRVLAPRQPGGPLYVGTVYGLQTSLVYVLFDRGNQTARFNIDEVYPVESWRTDRTANPRLRTQDLLMWQMLKKRMTERYDLKAVEALWLWFNARAFSGKLDAPDFGWINDWHIVGSFDFDRNRLVVNRGNNLTINTLAETVGHEIIHQYQQQVIPRDITLEERQAGLHGETFQFLRDQVRRATHIDIPFKTVTYDETIEPAPDFWTTTGTHTLLVLLTTAEPRRGGIVVLPDEMPAPGTLRAQYLQPGQRAALWEVPSDPRIEGALRGAGKSLAPLHPLIAKLIERAGTLVVRL